MVSDQTREFWGTLAHRGWRPYLGWGVSTGLILIVFAIAFRLFMGTLGLTEMAALAAAIVPVMQYIHIRGGSSPMPPRVNAPHGDGGLVNNQAIA